MKTLVLRATINVAGGTAAAILLAGCIGSTRQEETSTSGRSEASVASTLTSIDGGSDASSTSELCWSSEPGGPGDIDFENQTEEFGLLEPLTGMYGHATAISDVNQDGWTDLFVAGFADRPDEDYRVRGADGPSPDRLLLGSADGFSIDESFPGELARTSGATFADLDNDGDLDLTVVRNPREGSEISERATTVYENTSPGWSLATSMAENVGGRSVAAADIDRDGTLDLLIAGDRFRGGPTRFYRGIGGLQFVDSTADWGVPDDMTALALATVDLNDDGWLDVVFSGDERVLMGAPNGFVVERHPVLTWELYGNEDDPAGIAVGDLDNDGRPDLVVGQHFNSTLDFDERVPVRVFLNRSQNGELRLIDVTEESGSPALWTKSPHVAIADLDNDGHPDIVTSAASADGTPFVLRNTGLVDGIPQFEPINEPGDGSYYVTGATADFDRDGRIDIFQMAWEPTAASGLWRNVGGSGNWIELDLTALGSRTTGAQVSFTEPDNANLVARAWVESTTGYAAGAANTIHIGLGDVAPSTMTVLIEPLGGDPISVDATSNGRATIFSC